MSTIVAQTLSNGTVSTSTANCIQGSAKATCMWTTISGTVAIYNNFNVSSVIRNSQGNYTVNLINAMANNAFVCVSSANSGGVSALGATPTFGDRQSSATPTTTTTVTVINGQTNSGSGINDATWNSLAVFGA